MDNQLNEYDFDSNITDVREESSFLLVSLLRNYFCAVFLTTVSFCLVLNRMKWKKCIICLPAFLPAVFFLSDDCFLYLWLWHQKL